VTEEYCSLLGLTVDPVTTWCGSSSSSYTTNNPTAMPTDGSYSQGSYGSYSSDPCLATGCPTLQWIGDNICDASCNNAACNFDGGDCSGSSISSSYTTNNPTVMPATISGSVTLSGFENAAAFTADHKLAFGTAIAEALGDDVTAAQVAVTVVMEITVAEATFRYLVVSYTVLGLNAAQATAATATISATTPASFLTTLKTQMAAQNVTPPTGMEMMEMVISTPTAAIPEPTHGSYSSSNGDSTCVDDPPVELGATCEEVILWLGCEFDFSSFPEFGIPGMVNSMCMLSCGTCPHSTAHSGSYSSSYSGGSNIGSWSGDYSSSYSGGSTSHSGSYSSSYSGGSNSVRLSGGNTGLLEINLGTGWGTVCDDSFGQDDADVVCRQLGYSNASSWGLGFGSGYASQPILMDDVKCSGAESSVLDCWFISGSHNCGHNEDVGMTCVAGASTHGSDGIGSWADLSEGDKVQWSILGWTSEGWDNNVDAASEALSWADLSVEEQEAAGKLGYVQESWDSDTAALIMPAMSLGR
jgi:hypothetical protein